MILRKIPYRSFASEGIKVRAVLVGKWKQKHKSAWATDDRTRALRMVLDKNRGWASKPGSFTPLSEPPASTQEAGRVQTLWRRNIMALGCYSGYTGAKGDVRPQCILPFQEWQLKPYTKLHRDSICLGWWCLQVAFPVAELWQSSQCKDVSLCKFHEGWLAWLNVF